MQKQLYCFFFLLIALYSNAQNYDHQWVFGYSAWEEEKFGISLLDFNEGSLAVSFNTESDEYSLGFTGSFLNDRQGQLLLHTNHCTVRDKEWQVISGDEQITTTGLAANSCFDGIDNYGALQSVILLPDLQDSTLTYVLHKDFILDFDADDVYTNNLWFSVISEQAGEFVFEKKHTINDTLLASLKLTACPNKDKDGWWILIAQQNSNIFERYLIRNGVVVTKFNQPIGIPWNSFEIDIGQAQYSPDARYFAVNSEAHGVLLYDFNNQTGLLSNFRTIPYPDSENVAKGLCFSPNSRFIYVTTAENVYQIDLENDDEVFHVGYYRSWDETGWPVGLGMIFGGPDCRLYVSPGSTTPYLHVILNPDEKGAACNFAERIIPLPARVSHHLLNLPQYRYLNGCDSNIGFPFMVAAEELEESMFTIHPNPASTMLHIETDLNNLTYHIYDLLGHIIQNGEVQQKRINIESVSEGMYYLVLENREGERYTQKVMILR